MGTMKYNLNPNEKIVFKASNVRHGFWGMYGHILVVTNQAVILEEYGLFNNFKDIIRYPLSEINQAIIGKAQNGEKQLELYFNDRTEDFALQSGDELELNTLAMAINDQLSENADLYDYNFYQTLSDSSKEIDEEVKKSAYESNDNDTNVDVQSGLKFAGDIAKNVLKSGDFSAKGIGKGLNKAMKKQQRRSIFDRIKDEILDDIGVYDIQDGFTEIANDFREELGLPHKMTHEERRDMIEKEKEKQEKEIIRRKKEAYNKQVSEAKASIMQKQEQKTKTPPINIQSEKSTNEKSGMTINEQLEALKQLKELLDMGALTQEEFDVKKKEIMNL